MFRSKLDVRIPVRDVVFRSWITLRGLQFCFYLCQFEVGKEL